MTTSPNQLLNLIGELKQKQTQFNKHGVLFKNACDQAGYLDAQNCVVQKPGAAMHIENMKTSYISMQQQKTDIDSMLTQISQLPHETFQGLSEQDAIWLEDAMNNLQLRMLNELTSKNSCLFMLGVDCEWNE